jgi:hypothetical protein
MQRIPFKTYLRSTQLNREVAAAVRYAKDTPAKTQVMREYFVAAIADIDSITPDATEETK